MAKRRSIRAAVAAVTVGLLALAIGADPPAAQAQPPQPPPAEASPRPKVAETPPKDAVDPRERDRVLAAGWRTSADVAWTTSGDSSGLHVLVAAARDGYRWRTVASLAEPGFDADMWIGNACLTGSGRRLVVVYAPRTFTNDADLFDRGGFTAVVDLRTGKVTKLPVQSSLAYFNPGCGTGETAVLSQFGGKRVDDPAVKQVTSRLITVDASKGTLGKPLLLKTELSSPVPVKGGIVAAGAGRLVKVDSGGRLRGIAATSGTAFRLAADRDGGVVFLEREGDRARARRTTPKANAATATLAEGGLTAMGLTTGAAGRVFLTGRPASVRTLPATVKRVDVPSGATLSSAGAMALVRVGYAKQTDPRAETDGGDGPARDVAIEARSLAKASTLTFTVTPDASGSGAESATGRDTHPKLRSGPRPATARGGAPSALGSPTNPVEDERYCSVPRNDLANQAMQPKPRQVEWAVDQLITRSLTLTRPANWKNLGMPAYSPQTMFPQSDLLGSGGRVPAQIMLGIIAQESNMWQAPGFVLPGATGNPLIGNFYGRDIYNSNPGDDWDIHWDKADCGYGVTQVTDRMRLAGREKPGETAYPYQTQRAVALDFVANIAAGLQILQTKWNQVRAPQITVNNGDPAKMENWFMAVWAYNSGFHPDLGNGEPWGVGWGNNPINPRFDPQRLAFLDTSYDDARTPQKWPYPEKVMGWAGHPVEVNESPTKIVSGYAYAGWITAAERTRVKPPLDLFCNANNNCTPGQKVQPNAPGLEEEPPGPCLNKDGQGRYDLRCWYHNSVEWKGGPGTTCWQCGTEALRFDPGYAYQEDGTSYPPNCGTMPGNWRIIDDTPDGTASVRPDCPRTWTNAGSFGFEFPSDSAGNYPAKVDLHQIGGGFGGHFYFGHTRYASQYGGKMRVNATWRMGSALNGWYQVRVAIPDHRAWTMQADYTINLGNGQSRHRVINQVRKQNVWVILGVFQMGGTPSVTLNTVTRDGIGDDSIAFDAVAFVPASAPTAQYVAMGDSYSAGEGVEPYVVDSDHQRDNGGKNACHRSIKAYPMLLRRPGASVPIQQEHQNAQASFGFIACSGALTTSITDAAVNSPPSSTDNAGNTDWGSQHHRWGELPQVDTGWLDQDTSLVTVSIGGNDARFTDVLRGCILVNPLEGCYADNHKLRRANGALDPVELRYFEAAVILDMLPAKLKTAYRAIHSKAPNAQIVVMGYPPLFPDRPWQTCTGVNTTTQRFLNNLSGMLSLTIANAVHDLYTGEGINIRYVDSSDAWRDGGSGDNSHWACPTGSADSWTNMIINWSETGSGRDTPGSGSFHPKEAGQSVSAILAGAALRTPTTVAGVADQIQTQAAANNFTMTDAQAEMAARRCLELTRKGGLVGDPCMTLPIIFPSVANAGGAARNDEEGLAKNPPWVMLRYASNNEMKKVVPRGWYTQVRFQPNQCSTPPDPSIVNPQCDEFPYYSSIFAGSFDEFVGYTSPVSTNLKWVAATENNAEGNLMGTFFSRCGIPTATYEESDGKQTGAGGRFLAIPLVQEGAPNTAYVCPLGQ